MYTARGARRIPRSLALARSSFEVARAARSLLLLAPNLTIAVARSLRAIRQSQPTPPLPPPQLRSLTAMQSIARRFRLRHVASRAYLFGSLLFGVAGMVAFTRAAQ